MSDQLLLNVRTLATTNPTWKHERRGLFLIVESHNKQKFRGSHGDPIKFLNDYDATYCGFVKGLQRQRGVRIADVSGVAVLGYNMAGA